MGRRAPAAAAAGAGRSRVASIRPSDFFSADRSTWSPTRAARAASQRVQGLRRGARSVRRAPPVRPAPGRRAPRRRCAPGRPTARARRRAAARSRSFMPGAASLSAVRLSIEPRSRSRPRIGPKPAGGEGRPPAKVAEEAVLVALELQERVDPPERRVAGRRRPLPQLRVQRVPMRLDRLRDQGEALGQPRGSLLVGERPGDDDEEAEVAAVRRGAPRRIPARAPSPPARGFCATGLLRSSRDHLDAGLQQALDLVEARIVAQARAGRVFAVQRAEPGSEIQHGNSSAPHEQSSNSSHKFAWSRKFPPVGGSAAGIDKLLGHRQNLDLARREDLVEPLGEGGDGLGHRPQLVEERAVGEEDDEHALAEGRVDGEGGLPRVAPRSRRRCRPPGCAARRPPPSRALASACLGLVHVRQEVVDVAGDVGERDPEVAVGQRGGQPGCRSPGCRRPRRCPRGSGPRGRRSPAPPRSTRPARRARGRARCRASGFSVVRSSRRLRSPIAGADAPRGSRPGGRGRRRCRVTVTVAPSG